MAVLVKGGVLRSTWLPGLQFVRWRRVNVQRPRPPHYERALALAVLRPQYDWDLKPVLTTAETCRKLEEDQRYRTRPDNPLERILARELKQLLDSKKLVAILHTNPFSGDELFNARVRLKKENMKLEPYSRYVVKLAVEGTKYEAIQSLFIVHNALIFCDEPRVAQLLKILKKIPFCVLMAAIVEGRFLSVAQLQNYANIGNIDTARAQLVATLNSAGSRLVTQLTQAQTTLVNQLGQISDRKSQED